ncbi:MAG: sirohydrochlorin ferrochelatase [Oceanicoccus sp.]|jgi:sirohydrochlorin ferrochelatase
MKSLLIIAHGSRRGSSNQEVIDLAKQLQKSLQDQYAVVTTAFLELAEPSIYAGLNACVKLGATEITVLPYFLAAGRHVIEDVPSEVNRFREETPEITIEILQHIGAMPTILDVMFTMATQTSLSSAGQADKETRAIKG